jgi:hypothetical protein
LTFCLAALLQIGPLRQLRIRRHIFLRVLNIVECRHCPIHARLLVHVAKLSLPAKRVVLWNCARVLRAIVSAFAGELFDVEADLLSQELGQLLVDAVPPRKVGCQSVRTVALVNVDVFVLAISYLDSDGKKLLAAALTLGRVALSWLLYLRESLTKLRGLVRVWQVALLCGQAGLLLLR